MPAQTETRPSGSVFRPKTSLAFDATDSPSVALPASLRARLGMFSAPLAAWGGSSVIRPSPPPRCGFRRRSSQVTHKHAGQSAGPSRRCNQNRAREEAAQTQNRACQEAVRSCPGRPEALPQGRSPAGSPLPDGRDSFGFFSYGVTQRTFYEFGELFSSMLRQSYELIVLRHLVACPSNVQSPDET